MRIAVTYENEMVYEHFGHTKQIKIYDCEENRVTGSKVMATMCSGHASMAGLLKVIGANVGSVILAFFDLAKVYV